jgi:hypothetical protein
MIKYIKTIGLKGVLFVIASLKLILLSKKIFILEVSQGRETIIPKILRQDQLAESFRCYDPLLRIIDMTMDESTKYQFNV